MVDRLQSFAKGRTNNNQKLIWLLPIYLFLAPLIVALLQISALEFPTENPFFIGMPYSPFPQVYFFPLSVGVFLLLLSTLTTFGLLSDRYKALPYKVRILILVLSTTVSSILFWFGINMAQRSVIIEYLAAINANGLHFLRLYVLPIMPEVFPLNEVVAYDGVIVVGILGIVGIVSQHSILFIRREKISV